MMANNNRSLLITVTIFFIMWISLMTQHRAVAENNSANVPAGYEYAIEVNLPDDAIVALADFKFKVTKISENQTEKDIHCTGKISRFITGTDENKEVVFDCSKEDGRFWRAIVREPDYVPLDNEPLWQALDNDAAENCVVVYERNKDGSAKVFELWPNSKELIPAFEWLRDTRDRKADRIALAVMVLMDKTASPVMRDLAYRLVTCSNLSCKSRLEILEKAVELNVSREDVKYGVEIMARLDYRWDATKDDNIALLKYFVKGLTASRDVRDANIWLDALAYSIQRVYPPDYSDMFKEIADAVKKHEVSPAPELSEDMRTYNDSKKWLLKRLEPKPPSSKENPAPPATPNKTAPPANNGATSPPSGAQQP